MRAHILPRFAGLLAALTIPLAMAGCDVNLQPFAKNTGLYSIHGYLTSSNGPHYIRVKDLNDLALPGSTNVLDATVTLTNLETGATEILSDSIVIFAGVATHNFRSTMDVDVEETYEVTVERSDGRRGTAHATMPPRTETDLSPETVTQCNAAVRVEFPNVDEARFIDARVGMKYGGKLEWLDLDLNESYTGGLRRGFKPASFVDEIVPRTVTPFVDCQAERYCNLLDDKKIRIAYTHFGPDWPADSTTSDPLASEVTNGVGVFGGLRRDTLIATTDAELRCPGAQGVPCKPVPPPCPGGGTCTCPDV